MEVLRPCPLAIAQRLVHCAIAVSTAVLGQSHKDNVRCTAVDEQLGQLEAKEAKDLLISPGTLCKDILIPLVLYLERISFCRFLLLDYLSG